MTRKETRYLIAVCAMVSAACSPAVHSGVTDGGISYESVGTGPSVVLIHGFSLDRRMWDAQVEQLRNSYHTIRYDLRGHGHSAPPDAPFQPHVDLANVLDAVGLDSVVLVGLSAGAEVAIDFALTFPNRVRGLLLASPGLSGYVPQGSFEWMSQVADALRAGDAASATERWIETPLMAINDAHADSVMGSIVRDNANIWTYRQDTRIPFEPPAVDRLDQLTMPIQVVVGADDLQDTHAVASLIATNAPNAKLQMVPTAGHLVSMASPEVFNQLLLEFLRDLL